MKFFFLFACSMMMFALCGFEAGPDGAWKKDGISAGWLIAAPGWNRHYTVTPENFRKIDSSTGDMKVDGKTIRFQTKTKNHADGRIEFSTSLSSRSFPEIEHASYQLSLSFDKFRRLILDGNVLPVTPSFVSQRVGAYPGKPHRLTIEMVDATYHLDGNFSLFIQDDRKWGETISIRMNGRNHLRSGSLGIAVMVRKEPVVSVPVSLHQAANRSFRDEKAGDGVGGWTDQGPNNDLRKLKAGTLTSAGVSFRILDPEKNSGKSCIVLSASRKNFPKECRIRAEGASADLPYLYLLHAAAWVPPEKERIGTIRVVYRDGKKGEFPVIAGRDCGNWWLEDSFPNAGIAWETMNFESRIGLYASAFPMAGVPETITFTAEGKSVWMICAASFANHGARFSSGDRKLIFRAGKEWLPVRFSRRIEAGSPLDFSGSLDAPAGKYGRVVVNKKGHFVFERNPEKRIRFLGVNLCTSANFMTHQQSEALAEHLASVGYNSVRFHHFENDLLDKKANDSVTFDPVMLDRFQYLMACLKKRGIYYTLDLYASRKLRKGDGIRNWSEAQNPKLLFDVEPSAMENWKKFVRRLLTSKNPYTGLSLAEDPALYVVNLVNEPNISFWLPLNKDSFLAETFRKRWAEYLSAAGVKGTPPGTSSGMYQQFRAGLELARIQEQTAFLRRELQSDVLVTDLNYFADYSLLGAAGTLDVVDMHSYWDHMRLLKPGRWSPPLGFSQLSALGQAAAHVRKIMPARIFGLPFLVSEINYCFPNQFRTEYGPMAGAYAALQDWDGLYRFQWAYAKEAIRPNGLISVFDIVNDPAAQLADRLIHALFIRGDVSAAPSGIAVDFRNRDLRELDAVKLAGIQSHFQTFSLLGLFTRVGALPEGRTFDDIPKLDLAGLWQEALPEPMKARFRTALNQQRIVSETGEIVMTPSRKSIEVVTPRTEAFAGASGSFRGRVLLVDGVTSPQAVALISLDANPLAESRKILMIHLVDMANSDMEFRNSRCTILETYGKSPLLLARRKIKVALRLPFRPKVETLDFEGRRTGPVPTSCADGVVRFTADTALRNHGVMAYLIAR